jgi:peptidoglycan/LPS O-acetylase OafA/YrhL
MHCLTSLGGIADTSDRLYHRVTMIAAAIGGAGVDIFFVLSGFIIFALVERDRSDAPPLRRTTRFLIHRCFRIFPPYWTALLATILLQVWFDPRMPIPIDAAVLTLTTTRIAFLPQAWTLAFEVWFYAGTAALLLLPRRHLAAGLLAWTAIQAALFAVHRTTGGWPTWPIFAKPLVLEFFLGCAVARLCDRRPLPVSAAAAILPTGLALFLAGGLVCYRLGAQGSFSDLQRVVFWGVSSGLAVWALVSLERAGREIWPDLLVRLGDHSYSIYLWHIPVLSAFFVSGLQARLGHAKIAQAAIEFLVTLAVASLSYRLIERPSVRLSHRLA